MKRILALMACLPILLSFAVPAFATGGEGTEQETYTYVSELNETTSDVPEDSIPAVLIALFGEYTPRTQTVTQILSDGSELTYDEYVPGLAGLDWHWLSSVGLFGMGLFCVFRVIGGCIKWI